MGRITSNELLLQGIVVIKVVGLGKTYDQGPVALRPLHLNVNRGEILALLGPNGAGKSTLINMLCGLVRPSMGSAQIHDFDIVRDYRKTRALVGLVPQEIVNDVFETVWSCVNFSRGLFGLAPNVSKVQALLERLSLWDKRDEKVLRLSGGMKRRVMIAKALIHEPKVLFLDEPSAGVDVNLRHDMWALIKEIQTSGVTVVLTTHYLEEAEHMADRIAIIDRGELLLLEEKQHLMSRLGQKLLKVSLSQPIQALSPDYPAGSYLSEDGNTFLLPFSQESSGHVHFVLQKLMADGHTVLQVETHQNRLEDIFLNITQEKNDHR